MKLSPLLEQWNEDVSRILNACWIPYSSTRLLYAPPLYYPTLNLSFWTDIIDANPNKLYGNINFIFEFWSSISILLFPTNINLWNLTLSTLLGILIAKYLNFIGVCNS